jgi:VWFA-related protein
MADRLEAARAAALGFFQQTIEAKDRAALLTFNDRPYLAVKFTNQLATFAGGLAGLKAERGTALYDSLIYSLFHFSGIRGQRALLVLSDGKDEVSRFGFEETLEYARRAGVTLYTIGLDSSKKAADERKKLTRLAEETGGRSFFLTSIGELPSIYEQIQRELRSQYLIAYQSSNTARDDDFRSVELTVARRGVEVRTMRGYYP